MKGLGALVTFIAGIVVGILLVYYVLPMLGIKLL
jgi:hypothetical protein